ncbi:MAG: hypothetical protein JNM66_12255 [Bryobacterales bacterium]|nr:hypothetical protein [Bryobacterales bacterium]
MSSIQVNGQTSNTIIAGTKDDVTINGSCLGTATSAQTNGTGLQFLSIASTTDAQVNASFQADITASTGTHSVTLNTVNGVITASSSSQLFVTRAMLQSFSFSDSVPYNRDCVMNYTPMSTPIYPAPPASATVVCPQIGFAGDHAVYVSGNTMGGTAVFSLTPAPPQGLTGLYVEGTTAAHGTFTATGGVSITGGAATFSAPVSTGTPLLAGRTQFINPLEIT